MEIYELSEKEFRIILLSVLNYKNTQTTKQNREEMHEQNEKLNKEMKKKWRQTLYSFKIQVNWRIW